MNHFDLEIFLTIVHTKTISNAANALFLAPSTVGARLKALEDELGFPLIIRKKGYKSIQLTQKGSAFIPYAEQWLNIWNQSLQLREQPDIVNFSISQSSSLFHFAAPLYQKFRKLHASVQLRINTVDSEIAYSLVQQNQVNIGLVMYPFREVNHVTTTELFKEPLVLAYGSHYHVLKDTPVSIHEFPLENQILLIWNNGFESWYSQHIPPYTGSLLKVNSTPTLLELFSSEYSWAVVPYTVAKKMQSCGLADFCPVAENPPARSAYYIYNCRTAENPLVLDFVEILKQAVKDYPF